MNTKPVLVTGIKPTGEIHLGNYFGAVKPVLDIIKAGTHEVRVFIADYHAMTALKRDSDNQFDYRDLRDNTYQMACALTAFGITGEDVHLFLQSDVPLVTEMLWMLGSVTPLGLISRNHAMKAGIDPNFALFSYPVLMASDILTLDADVVPVGRDQIQHLEIARDIAAKFNNAVNAPPVFKMPEPLYALGTEVVPGIDGRKMSKSYGNTICPFSDAKTIRKQVAKIVTDSAGQHDPKDPDASTIFKLYSLMATPDEISQMRQDFTTGAYGYGVAKKMLADKILEYFAPARKKYEDMENLTHELYDDLNREGEVMRHLAARQVAGARKALGLFCLSTIACYDMDKRSAERKHYENMIQTLQSTIAVLKERLDP